MKLKDYIWDIYEIAKRYNTQPDIAMDMFIANLNQKADKYQGANVDYEKLGTDWRAMSLHEQHREKVEFNRITKAYLVPLSKAWRAKDRKAFDSVIASIDGRKEGK